MTPTERRLTVVQMLPALDAGGVERGTLEVARALVAAGHRSIVISRGGRLVAQLEREGSEHIALPVHRKSLASLFQVRPLRRRLAELKPDIVHARSRVPAWIAWLALRKLPAATRPHFVTTVHGLYSVSPYSAIMTRGERVIAVSETVRDYIRTHYPSCPPERIELIYRGIEPAEFPHGYQPSADWLAQWQADYPQLIGKQVLTLPGRITRLKGHDAFLDLIAALRRDGVNVHGLIVGGAEAKKQAYLSELQQAVATRGLNADISFTGHRSDIREILAVSDIAYSLSTKPESFGRTTLEALSLGTPVIGWDQGGVGEILAHVFPAGRVARDDHARLLACTREVLRGDHAPAAQHDFTLERMLARTLATYQRVATGA